uniref:Uncharacterized protein n=1 Tax=Photinus pyralis TaxID=7054 RepID=A0A1Y1KDL2_PHOPY
MNEKEEEKGVGNACPNCMREELLVAHPNSEAEHSSRSTSWQCSQPRSYYYMERTINQRVQTSRLVGCFCAIAKYVLAKAILAFLPHTSNIAGMSKKTKQSTATKMCMFLRPIPLIQGVSAKRTTTESTLREKTMPTMALPMIS